MNGKLNGTKRRKKMAKEVRLEQGTPEWIKYRKEGLGASDIPAVLKKISSIVPYISLDHIIAMIK